jgi:hypothetical protein
MRPSLADHGRSNRRRIRFLLLAGVISACAAPAFASPVQVTSYDGTYTVSYDTAQQSPAINQINTFPGTGRISLGGNFVGDQDPDGPANGILETIFNVQLNVQFRPTAGHAFDPSLPLSIGLPGQVGYHHGFFGGEEFGETTTITDPAHSSVQTLNGPLIINIPPWGQGGGGAFNNGIPFGDLVAFPGGFDANVLITVVLFDNSSFNCCTVDFAVRTVAAAATPLPAAFPMFATGLGALGVLARRRKRKQAAA